MVVHPFSLCTAADQRSATWSQWMIAPPISGARSFSTHVAAGGDRRPSCRVTVPSRSNIHTGAFYAKKAGPRDAEVKNTRRVRGFAGSAIVIVLIHAVSGETSSRAQRT